MTTLLFVAGLWTVLGLFAFLLRNRLGGRHRNRWITIAAALSFYALAEKEIGKGENVWWILIFHAVIILTWYLSARVYERLRRQIVNVALGAVGIALVIVFIYLNEQLERVAYVVLALVSGVLLFISYRGGWSTGRVERAGGSSDEQQKIV